MNAQTQLQEIVKMAPGTAKVLERHGLDFCCQGARTLAVACAAQGLAVEQLLAELQQATRTTPTVAPTASLAELTNHIVTTHHAYVRESLPTIAGHTAKVARVHGPRHAELAEVDQLFAAVVEEMTGHMAKEEQILFPYMVALERFATGQGEAPHACFPTVAAPIRVMEMEHESAGGALARIRALTANYTPPADACTTYRLMLQELQAFEEDLHVHVHLENYVLHPRALALEEQLAAQL
jgi:regulator of cell morphogenesis and NO signaling